MNQGILKRGGGDFALQKSVDQKVLRISGFFSVQSRYLSNLQKFPHKH